MSVCVYCGNGGDYEFELEREYWRLWIEHHVTITPFIIIPHPEADKAEVIFESDKYDIVFALLKPQYITFNDVQDYIKPN